MRFLILTALLCASPALASKRKEQRHQAPPHSDMYCGPMGDESMACVADELAHGWPAIVSVECYDGAEALVRVWIDNAGKMQISPPTYAEACK